MVKRLKKRFLTITMLSVFIVLLILNVAINTLNYKKMIDECDNDLSFLNGINDIQSKVYVAPDIEPYGAAASTSVTVLGGNIMVEGLERMHVSVTISKDMKVEYVWSNIVGLNSADILEMSQSAVTSGKTRGFIDNYRFAVSDSFDDGWYVSFVDVSEARHNFNNFLTISISVSVVCMAVLSVVLFFVADKAISPIVESYEKQKRFITDAGHEIKTPLTIINADADVLTMSIGKDNEWINDIKKQTKRMTELTNDLILLSKMDEVHKNALVEDVDIKKSINDHLDSFKSVIDRKNIKTEVETEDVIVKGDHKMIDELISILTDNAVKYCPEGKSIKIICSKDQKNANIEMTNDTQEDIDKESLKKLFERFYRTDSSHNSETGGHGIGLSIAKAIVDSHGGKISASKKEKNTITFTVSFPVQ